jgi:hypothetical protein
MKTTISDRAMSQVFADVEALEENSRPSLPEHLFLRDWLSFFLGVDTPEIADKKRGLWRRITAGVPRRVNIVDATGNVVVVIPVLMSTELIASNKMSNDRYVGLFQTYATLARRAIPEGDRWMAAQREAIEKHIFGSLPDTQVAQEWMALFDHYKVQIEPILKEYGRSLKQVSSTHTSSSEPLVVDGYDEA